MNYNNLCKADESATEVRGCIKRKLLAYIDYEWKQGKLVHK